MELLSGKSAWVQKETVGYTVLVVPQKVALGVSCDDSLLPGDQDSAQEKGANLRLRL